MIAADSPDPRAAKLLIVDARGNIRSTVRKELAALFSPDDLIVANDAATLPASLRGVHGPTGAPIEVRLAGWIYPGDQLALGPLQAVVAELCGHPRLLTIRFCGDRDAILAGIARHGRPILYAHVAQPLVLWDVWTRFAAVPLAFEAPSAGFALDWRTLIAWRERGLKLATLTHAAGISSTGDPALDIRLPFDEHFCIPPATAAAIAQTRARGGRVVAVGTTVVRALEAAADACGRIRAGSDVARGRIGSDTELHAVDTILTGAHEPGESHFELLRAFADDETLNKMSTALEANHFRGHEFGDSVLIERTRQRRQRVRPPTTPPDLAPHIFSTWVTGNPKC